MDRINTNKANKTLKHIAVAIVLGLFPLIASAELQLNGIAEHWALGRQYYIGALYLPEPQEDADVIIGSEIEKRMELRITYEKWRSSKFISMWNNAIYINNVEHQEEYDGVADILNNFYDRIEGQSLLYGDQLTVNYLPGKGTNISINGYIMVETKDQALFNVLLRTWIGKRPPSSDFKVDILKMKNGIMADEMLETYEFIEPTKTRKQEVYAFSLQGEKEKEEKASLAAAEAARKKAAAEAAAKAAAIAAEAEAAAAAATTSATGTDAEALALLEGNDNTTEASETASEQNTTTDTAGDEETSETTAAPSENIAATEAAAEDTEEQSESSNMDERRLFARYKMEVRRMTLRKVDYPERSLYLKQEGDVLLKLVIERNGDLEDVDTEERSKFSALNKAAKKAAKRAAPFPALPEELEGDKFEVYVPVKFRVPG